MELTEILTTDLILYPVQATTKEDVISQLVNVLVKNGKLSEPEEAKSAIIKREEVMTTGVGKGVALPHGKYAHTEEVLISFGISKEGVNFDAIDGQPVHIFVLLLTPEKYPSKHLKLLSKFSRMLNIAECREELLTADSATEIAEILYRYDKTM
ncbi:MAG TPA: PTS fructose transporter subunit IIA [Candidatus Marinimicrobia bacterium]|nr:PTS fructose transporter subunit IIA [Candidatus Neomarinimicrobiota bacterium]